MTATQAILGGGGADVISTSWRRDRGAAGDDGRGLGAAQFGGELQRNSSNTSDTARDVDHHNLQFRPSSNITFLHLLRRHISAIFILLLSYIR